MSRGGPSTETLDAQLARISAGIDALADERDRLIAERARMRAALLEARVALDWLVGVHKPAAAERERHREATDAFDAVAAVLEEIRR